MHVTDEMLRNGDTCGDEFFKHCMEIKSMSWYDQLHEARRALSLVIGTEIESDSAIDNILFGTIAAAVEKLEICMAHALDVDARALSLSIADWYENEAENFPAPQGDNFRQYCIDKRRELLQKYIK